jgi:cell wall-associated NlpC family hydrolase
MTTRLDVVACARSWLGTPFHHQARLRSVGVDCAGLVIGVARELGFVPEDFDVGGYGRLPDGKSLMECCCCHMEPVGADVMLPGDVLVVTYDQAPQHLGVLGDYRHGGLSLIHAASRAGRVIETRLMFSRSMRFVGAFRFPGVT